MRMKLLALILLLAPAGCKQDERREEILTKPQMVDWMIDVYLAESRVTTMAIPLDSAYKLFIPYQDTLMKRKGIQDSVLKRSYQFYLERPAEMESIYDAVIDSLSLKEQRLLKNPAIGKP